MTGRGLSITLPLVLALTGCAGTQEPVATPAADTPPAAGAAASAEQSPSATSPDGQRIEVTVAGGEVRGDVGRVPVGAGERVTLVVTSDASDEIHVHGYDLTAAVAPDRPAELAFDATVPGVFEVELHEAGTVLLTLQVG